MIKADKYFKRNLRDLLKYGSKDINPRPRYRDGTPAHSIFISQAFEKYDIANGEFPITTLRNTAVKTGYKEMLWIYQQQSNKLSDARELGIHWWDDWDIGDGTIGQRYGATVAKYGLIDELLYNLEHHMFERRHIIDLFQYSDMKQTKGLVPCAFQTLWTPRNLNGKLHLDLTLVQRSNDYIMAGYINKIQYVSLMMMVCSDLRSKGIQINEGSFAHLTQNLHIYDRHCDAAYEILKRESIYIQPAIRLPKDIPFYDFLPSDISSSKFFVKKLDSDLEIAI